MGITAKTSAGQSPNYFDYFTEIEEAFIRHRGKHLLLSPLDWTLMECWKEKGIPLHVVLCSIETVFNRHRRLSKGHSVNSLSYCQNEVEFQFTQWLKNQVGSENNATEGSRDHNETESHLPFPRLVILEHLANCHTTLKSLLDTLGSKDEFTETLRDIIAQLENLELNFAQAKAPDCGELEFALVKLESRLYKDTLTRLPPDRLTAWHTEAELQLTRYRSRMKSDDYQHAVANLLHKYMCERIGIPRLSLFSL